MKETEDRPARATHGGADDSGFTLIELMVSLSIIAIVGTFALSAQTAATRATRTEANRQVAAQLLARELDGIRGLGGSSAADVDPQSTEQIGGLDFDVTRAVDTCWQVLSAVGPTCGANELPDSAEMAHIEVTVSWMEGTKMSTQHGEITINADSLFPA